jgi:hypothetical protein
MLAPPITHRSTGTRVSRDLWRTAVRRLALSILQTVPRGRPTTGPVRGLALRITCVEAWASGPGPATTPAVAFRSARILALRDDSAGPMSSLLDLYRVVLRAG